MMNAMGASRLQRFFALFLGARLASLVLPVVIGPARGLWFRRTPQITPPRRLGTKRAEALSSLCRRGWTVWDCAGDGVSTILFSKFVGAGGLVVSFEPDRANFMRTFDNADLNGCTNILFLFATVGAPAPQKAFQPPVKARQLSLAEAFHDGEIPRPDAICLDFSKEPRVLDYAGDLVEVQRPHFVMEGVGPKEFQKLEVFASRHRYELTVLETGEALTLPNTVSGTILCRPLA